MHTQIALNSHDVAVDVAVDLESIDSVFAALKVTELNSGKHSARTETLVQACLSATTPASNSFMVFREVGEFLLTMQRWVEAEEMGVRSLKASPRYGAAFRLMGCALSAQGLDEDANLCHRYNLPESMRTKYFADTPITWIGSTEDESTCRIIQAYPSTEYSIEPPWQQHPTEIRELSVTTLRALEAKTYRLAGGRLWFDSFNTIVWDSKHRVVRDICRGYAEVVNGSVGDLTPMKLSGTVALLSNRNQNNYYHWMNDVVPRLDVLRNSGFSLNEIDHFVLDALKYPFQMEMLEHFGIDEDRVHWITTSEYIEADELLIPVYGSNSLGLRQGAWNPAFLRNEFVSQPSNTHNKRLYICRGSEGARGVANEEALIEHLQLYGFEPVRCETLTVREQAALFDSADVVLGAHGAGFTNIAFCVPGTLVVEFYGEHIEPCFWATSTLAGLRHAVYHCSNDDHSQDDASYHQSHDVRRGASITVDLNRFDSLLSDLDIQRR